MVGGKAVIVEDGKPTMIIMEVDEYMGAYKKVQNAPQDNLSEKELIEKINKDISIWNSRQEERRLRQLEMEDGRKLTSNLQLKIGRNNEGIVVERL